MDLDQILQSGYVFAALAVLAISGLAPLRTRFLDYGARSKTNPSASSPSNAVESALDALAAIRVKHSWFLSFYVASIACSVLWFWQVIAKGSAFRAIVECIGDRESSTAFSGVALAWTMLFVQGTRRLFECIVLARPSASEMWIGHWILGLGFYVVTNIAVWIEGAAALEQHTYSVKDLVIAMPSLRSFASLTIFLLASGLQHDCHAYLFALRERNKGKYHLPQHPAFARIVSPHYTAECLIYLALAIAAAPRGQYLNRTLVAALFFVVVNLGVTAGQTKAYYQEKFGTESVQLKWAMLPLIY